MPEKKKHKAVALVQKALSSFQPGLGWARQKDILVHWCVRRKEKECPRVM